jgi:23S rRNA (cytosine1962-C5)-methyltransferase
VIEGTVWLKAGREKKIRHLYPWVQREEIARVDGAPTDGGLVRLLDHAGTLLGIATYHARSRFPARLLTMQDEAIDTAFFARRFEAAARLRQHRVQETDAFRLVFSEADGVPGLIVDRYADYLVLQVRTLGMERLKPLWLPALIETQAPKGILERSEMESRREEGLKPFTGILYGHVPEWIPITESGLHFLVPTTSGLKTGFYLDQRENRRQLARLVQPGERVLDLFCYTGAFALYAARAGAIVRGVDILPEAIELARQHAALNQLSAEWEVANAFEWLPASAERGELYDWVILDPPAIAKRREQRESLRWAIWKLVYHALPLLAPDGRMLVCNCAYTVDLSLMVDMVRLAAHDRGRALYLEDVSFQAPDHPFLLQFPESLYLKCLWLRAG